MIKASQERDLTLHRKLDVLAAMQDATDKLFLAHKGALGFVDCIPDEVAELEELHRRARDVLARLEAKAARELKLKGPLTFKDRVRLDRS